MSKLQASVPRKKVPRKLVRRKAFLRIFVVESPNPLDAMQGRAEGPSIEAVGRLIGHEVMSCLVRSERELHETCRFIGSIDSGHDDQDDKGRPLCLHISAHGNASSIQIGADAVGWEDLVKAIQPFVSTETDYEGDRIVVLSACEADRQKLSKSIERMVKRGESIVPPRYLFCTTGEVTWQDAVVGWTLFYHLLPKLCLDYRLSVQSALDRAATVGAGRFVYYRWDSKAEKYLRYQGKALAAR